MKTLGVILTVLVLVVIGCLINSLFLYVGWNFGVVPAISGTKEITLVQAFFLGLAARGIIDGTKATVSNKD